jgi:cellulose biosynthesis protein BcsQ
MKVITCFSYKGGAARTTAAANIAAALASVRADEVIDAPLSRKVAILDLDVFSAGTHRVFDISNRDINEFSKSNRCIQDYLCQQIAPGEYASRDAISWDNPLMDGFKRRGALNGCHREFTLFPARPDPETKFVVQKQHENLLLELLIELENNRSPAFDYAILDGESGTRQMADIALRLADVILVFFRLTWQHIDGTLNTLQDWERKFQQYKPVYLIPTCVPLIDVADNIYQAEAPGLMELRRLTSSVPGMSGLNDYARDHSKSAGHFWADMSGAMNRLCIHESLRLKGEERVIVFDEAAHNDRAAKDFYQIAAEIDKICHQPSPSS